MVAIWSVLLVMIGMTLVMIEIVLLLMMATMRVILATISVVLLWLKLPLLVLLLILVVLAVLLVPTLTFMRVFLLRIILLVLLDRLLQITVRFWPASVPASRMIEILSIATRRLGHATILLITVVLLL